MRRSNIGHASQVGRAWGQRTRGRGGGRGLDPRGGILILVLRVARSKRLGMGSIGRILCITNEGFEEALVSGIGLRRALLSKWTQG